MITGRHKTVLLGIIGVVVFLVSSPAFAGPIVFKGQLGAIVSDGGGAIYSGVPIGTEFSIEFDPVTGQGSISDGVTLTPLSAIFVDGNFFEVTNNEIIDDTTLLNSLAGTNLMDGDPVDIIEIFLEGSTSGGGIIIGVVYYLDSLTFNDGNPNNFPPDPDDVLITLFPIDEEDAQGTEFYEGRGVVEFDSILSPLCEIQLNQATYIVGDTVTADIFRFANLTANPVATERKIWLGVPGIPPISVTNVGSDGSVVLPAGTDVDYGPLQLFPVTTALPTGNYEISCRLLAPITGSLLWEDLNFFDIR